MIAIIDYGAGNLFNTLFPKMGAAIENFSAKAITKILDNRLNVLKSADVYDGVDNKSEISALENIREILTNFVKEKNISFINALDLALGSMVTSARYSGFNL